MLKQPRCCRSLKKSSLRPWSGAARTDVSTTWRIDHLLDHLKRCFVQQKARSYKTSYSHHLDHCLCITCNVHMHRLTKHAYSHFSNCQTIRCCFKDSVDTSVRSLYMKLSRTVVTHSGLFIHEYLCDGLWTIAGRHGGARRCKYCTFQEAVLKFWLT